MIPKQILVIYMKPRFKIEEETLNLVIETLKGYKLKFIKHERTKDYRDIIKNIDLIIVIGGDGTFLLSSQFVKNIPMLGVNSNPERKEGFLMQTTKYDFKKKFSDFLRNKHKIVKITRLQPVLNGKKLRPALNEVFVGHVKSYKMIRYKLTINNKEELQRSSGIIISTPIGSHAWALSARGKKMTLLSKKYQYVVREPYQGKLHSHKLLKGIISGKDILVINAQMNHGIISIDALSEDFEFKKGSILKIVPCPDPLNYVVFSDFNERK